MSTDFYDEGTILITGGTGFAGSHLVELLLKSGRADIHVTAFGKHQNSFVHTLLPEHNIHSLDLTDKEATFSLIKKIQPTQIYHLAAISVVGGSFEKASQIILNNSKLQLNLLEATKEITPQARLLIIGSAQEYDFIIQKPDKTGVTEEHPLGPANPYGVSKVDQDLLGLAYHYAYNLDVVRVRPFNHIGERQPQGFVMSDFAWQIVQVERAKQKVIRVGNLEAVRDFSDVKDVVAGYQLLMKKGKSGGVYNLGSGQGKSIKQILELMASLALVEIPFETDEQLLRPLDAKAIIANTSKIKSLGYQQNFSLSQTLERILNYWRQVP